MLAFILFVFLGTLAGFLSGLLGIGGGVIVVPGLIWIFQAFHIIPYSQEAHTAAGTSLAAMIVTALFSVRAHAKRGNVEWPVVKMLAPGMVVGVVAGAALASRLNTHTLEIILGIVLVLIAIRFFFGKSSEKGEKFPVYWIVWIIAFFVGLKSGLLGLGGGILIIPFLVYCGLNMRKASGTSAACTLPLAITGAICFILFGGVIAAHVPYSTGFVYWPAFAGIAIGSVLFVRVGTFVGARMKINGLMRVFAVVLFLVAVRLLIK
jgi:uncharacterized protein